MSSYLTPDELDAVQASGLDPFTPYVIENASAGLLSIAKHYGGCTYGGREYYYIPTTDELIREDVIKWVTTRRKEAQRAVMQEDVDRQMGML